MTQCSTERQIPTQSWFPMRGTVSYKSIAGGGDDNSLASVFFTYSGSMDHVRINSREGVRCASGNITIDHSWIENQGLTGDYSDGLQCYSSALSGVVTVTNTTFYIHPNSHTSYFSADDWRREYHFQKVLFWGTGGQFGLRIPYDGGSKVYLNDVYFVNNYANVAIQFDAVSGQNLQIAQWDNVRWATVSNGVLVPGSLIPCPMSNCSSTGGGDTTSPTSPTNLSASSTSQSNITVTWTAATDNIGVDHYLIERCSVSGCSNFTQIATPSSSPFVDTGLTANTFYNYHVRATDAAGNLSGWSNVVGTTTQGSTPSFSFCSTITPATSPGSTYAGYGALNGDWCQGSITTSITDADISTASATDPAYLVGMTCSVQGVGWKCGCRDTACASFNWQVQEGRM
ncbi:MAG: fibronectin type III domain-containing protein [Candidatus Moraniibacteriota bacterium]